MNKLNLIKDSVITVIQKSFDQKSFDQKSFELPQELISRIKIELNTKYRDTKYRDTKYRDTNKSKKIDMGDISTNGAMIIGKYLKQNPIEVAEIIKSNIKKEKFIEKIEIAGPGFINIYLTKDTWVEITKELLLPDNNFFKNNKKKKNYLIEFVSANPTGPLHLGHGRGGIIGDTLANILNFLGNTAYKEFYINDAGKQIEKLGHSLKIRCEQELGLESDLPEDGYAGEYMIELAKKLIKHYGREVLKQDNYTFEEYAQEAMLENQKETLKKYKITFDRWFSEKSLHKDGSVDKAIELLKEKNLIYEKDNAIWFKATEFGDDKDRVIKKSDGSFTYIASDIAYHKNKFDREINKSRLDKLRINKLINILGQDHHGYIKRLEATMQALGYEHKRLETILYQMVSIREGSKQIKMSKRAGIFEKLSDVIEKVGPDVARFYYLNRKANAHLDFDLEAALKKTDENPVYYIQYAYVRTKGILEKSPKERLLNSENYNKYLKNLNNFDSNEIEVIKKICSLGEILETIENNYQTHLLSYYTLELAKTFHNYYACNKIIDENNEKTTNARLILTIAVRKTLALCLDLLGLSKPDHM